MLPLQLPASLHEQLATSTNLFNKFASMPPYAHHSLVKSFVLDSMTELDGLETEEQNSQNLHPPTLMCFITSETEMEQEFKRAFAHVKIIRDRVFKVMMKYFLRFVAFHMHPVMQIPQKRAFWRLLFEFFFLNENAVAIRQNNGPDIFGFQETLHFLKNTYFQDLFSYWLLKQFFAKPHCASSSFVQLHTWVEKFTDLIWAQEQPQINEDTQRDFTNEELSTINMTLHISKDDQALFVAFFEQINWSVQIEPLPLNFLDDLHQRDFIFAQNAMSTPLSNIETATSRFMTSAADSENQVEEDRMLEMLEDLEKEIDLVVFQKLNP